MGPHHLSDEDEAMIAFFKQSMGAVGFDGVYSLQPIERGVVELSELVQSRTLLQVFTALGLKGKEAWELRTRISDMAVSMDSDIVGRQLHQIYRGN